MRFVDLATQQRRIRVDLDRRIGRVLDHGQYLYGPEVSELEQRLATFSGARHAITVASGTDALIVALLALDVGPGDEVITSPLSFVATAEAIRLIGARPVFCDIEPDTWLLDATRMELLITPLTRAIMPVDLYGQCADYGLIGRIARSYRIPVIADAAQSFGATQRGRGVGTLATLTATSFYPSTPLGAYGDGGAILTDDDELAQTVLRLRDHGRGQQDHFVQVGMNARLGTLQCAVLLSKLEVFDNELRRRRQIAATYDGMLRDRVGVPTLLPWNVSAWAHYTIEVDDRDAVQASLKARGVPTRPYYPRPLHLEPAYAAPPDQDQADCPQAERAASRVLSLPMHPYLELQEQMRVCEQLFHALSASAAASTPAGMPIAPSACDADPPTHHLAMQSDPPCVGTHRHSGS